MTIKLSYIYGDLDKTYCFGVVFNDAEGEEIYIRWLWYYLGQELMCVPDNFRLYPYNLGGKILKNYKYCNNAKRQASLLADAIKRKLFNKLSKK